MLPLSEGSVRLRPDDEGSLTSGDSFFSATEVRRGGGALDGRGGGGVRGAGRGGREPSLSPRSWRLRWWRWEPRNRHEAHSPPEKGALGGLLLSLQSRQEGQFLRSWR